MATGEWDAVSQEAEPALARLLARSNSVTGGYNGRVDSSAGWTGNSGGFVSVLANLPPAAAGKNVQLR
jgi:hypothetical protein